MVFVDDLVESILAALVNYHGYKCLYEDLFQVLRDVVSVGTADEENVFESKTIEQAPSAQAGAGGGRGERRRITPQELLVQFQTENVKRKCRRQESAKSEAPEDGISEQTPHKFWGNPQSEKVGDPEGYLDEELDEDVNDPTTSTQPPSESPQEPTLTYKLIQSITRLTQHYLTHPSPLLRLQLLDLVTTSSPLLAQSEREFLPLVNDVWPVLVERLYDSHPQVVISAARAVKRLVGVCGEFISSRVNDSWNRGKDTGASGVGSGGERGLCRLLEKAREQIEREPGSDRSTQVNVQKLASTQVGVLERGRSRMYSPAQQVWKALLDMLTSIVQECRLDEPVFDDILEIVAGEFERGHQRELEEAMRRVNHDAVWLELQRRRRQGVDRGWNVPEIEGVRFPEVVL